MNLTSILSEIKVVPANVVGGLIPGDLTSADFRSNFSHRLENDINRIELIIITIDKVKETPKSYRVWQNVLKVYFYPDTKTYEFKEIEPENIKGELYNKDWDYNIFKYRNDLSGLSLKLNRIKKSWEEVKFKENKIDLEVLKDIVDAFYFSSDPRDKIIKSSKEELFKKAYKELKKAEDSFVKVKDKIAQDNLDWIEPIALDLIQKYSNADMSTYKKS